MTRNYFEVNIPQTDRWMAHARGKWKNWVCAFDEWRDTDVDFVNSILVLDRPLKSASALSPSTPFREILGASLPKDKKWHYRPDLMEEAASWIVDRSKKHDISCLILEAGYAKSGDNFIKNLTTFEREGNLFFHIDVYSISIEVLTRYLRSARSSRVVGMLGAFQRGGHAVDGAQYFVFDVFDNDALAFAPIASRRAGAR